MLNKNLTIQGPGAGQLAISGNNYSRVFDVAQGNTVTLSGLTVKSGVPSVPASVAWDYYGGGILNRGTLLVSSMTVSGNAAATGGGIGNYGGTLTVTSSTVSTNGATNGGGISSLGGTVTVSNSVLSGNSATYGGGIYNAGGTVLVSNNSTLSGNYASPDYFGRGGYGGGIYNSGGTVTINNSVLSGNAAYVFGLYGGGGIYNDAAGTVTVENFSSISGNMSGFDESLSSEDVNNLGLLYVDGTSTIGILAGNQAK